MCPSALSTSIIHPHGGSVTVLYASGPRASIIVVSSDAAIQAGLLRSAAAGGQAATDPSPSSGLKIRSRACPLLRRRSASRNYRRGRRAGIDATRALRPGRTHESSGGASAARRSARLLPLVHTDSGAERPELAGRRQSGFGSREAKADVCSALSTATILIDHYRVIFLARRHCFRYLCR
jgi:hypothetical protein